MGFFLRGGGGERGTPIICVKTYETTLTIFFWGETHFSLQNHDLNLTKSGQRKKNLNTHNTLVFSTMLKEFSGGGADKTIRPHGADTRFHDLRL